MSSKANSLLCSLLIALFKCSGSKQILKESSLFFTITKGLTHSLGPSTFLFICKFSRDHTVCFNLSINANGTFRIGVITGTALLSNLILYGGSIHSIPENTSPNVSTIVEPEI
jgi:hypothetical protein